MSSTKRTAYGAIATALSTDLNTLANATASAASAAIDNRTTLELYADFELVLGSQSSRTAGCVVSLYITPSLDETNYADVSASSAELLGVFTLATGTGAQRVIIRNCDIPPGLFKVFVVNSSTQAFNASGNTVKYRLHSVEAENGWA
jgi:hypothetical protein